MSSVVVISLAGLLVGFIFSMPIAGPISILITSNALKGRVRYCNLAALGASLADFIYVFAAVFGLTRFYTFFKPVIPYVLLVGTCFLFFLGYKIARTTLSLDDMKGSQDLEQKGNQRSGFLTGFLLNFLNPTLFLGWLTSSFIVISLIAALGFDTGGLEQKVDNSFNSINKKGEDSLLRKKALSYLHLDTGHASRPAQVSSVRGGPSSNFSLLSSLLYAFFLSVGGVLWFITLAGLLARHRQRINIRAITFIIRSLGWALFVFGAFLAYQAIATLTK